MEAPVKKSKKENDLENLGFKKISNNLYRAEIDDYAIDFFDQGQGQLTVCFDHMGRPEALPSRTRDGWGYSFLSNHTADSGLFIKPDRSNWYRQKGLIEFLERLKNSGFFKTFNSVMTYGGSMGGYGALAFADLCEADTILSMNPQVSLSSDLVPWETRFVSGRKEDWSGALRNAADGCKHASKVYVIYDPYFSLDRRHIQLLEADKIIEIKLPFVGHHIPKHLKEMNLIGELYKDISEGSFVPVKWSKSFRKRRQLNAYWDQMSLHAKHSGKSEEIKRLSETYSSSTKKENHTMNDEQMKEAARAIGWGMWHARFKAENPTASEDQIKDAWQNSRESEIKSARSAIRALEKAGYTIMPS